jgi:hypothetical protein
MGGGGGHHGGHQFNYRRQLRAAPAGASANANATHQTSEHTEATAERLAAAALDKAFAEALQSPNLNSSYGEAWPSEQQQELQLRRRALREKLTSEVARFKQRSKVLAARDGTAGLGVGTAGAGVAAASGNALVPVDGRPAKGGAVALAREAAHAAFTLHQQALLLRARKPEELLAAGVITAAEATAARQPYKPPGEGITHILCVYINTIIHQQQTLKVPSRRLSFLLFMCAPHIYCTCVHGCAVVHLWFRYVPASCGFCSSRARTLISFALSTNFVASLP